MLRDLFFSIWYNDFGIGWEILIVGLFSFNLAIMIIVFARTKALNKKFNFKHYLLFILALLIMYQIIPVSFDFAALKHSNDENFSKAIKLENLAIKSAIIPYQKGAYYIKMAYFYKYAACYTQMMRAYKKAYNYIKTYKYNCWYHAILDSYSIGYYDETIAMIDDNYPLKNTVISKCYIMKRDFEKALFFINNDLEKKEHYNNLAIKAYILKQMGEIKEAEIFYKNAIKECKNNSKCHKRVNDIYNDYIGLEKKILEHNLTKKCLIKE